MDALFGFFLLSVLLTTGTSLECETCSAQGTSCSGEKVNCSSSEDACLTMVLESSGGEGTLSAASKNCTTKEACAQLKLGTSFNIAGVSGTIKEVTCNKALSTSASVLLALSGFLLLKVLF